MSYRSRRSSDRDRSHSSSYSSHKYDKYDKYDYRHRDDRHRSSDSRHRRDIDSHYRRDDSRDRSDRYSSSRMRSRSHRDRSRSRHRSSRSHSKHRDDYHHSNRSNHKIREHKELPETKYENRHESLSTIDNNPTQTNQQHSQELSYKSSDSDKCEIENHKSNNINDINQTDEFNLNNEQTTQSDSITTQIPMDLYDDEDPELKAERERIQKETLERLQKHLQSEGKKYPPPKPQASHPIFANDGSFLEMFKTMQNTISQQKPNQIVQSMNTTATATAKTTSISTVAQRAPVPTIKRRGGKILKTGIVQKQRTTEDTDDTQQPTDSWNAYLKEVKRYKNVTCGDDNMTRSLVK